jgi:hypothetical protein
MPTTNRRLLPSPTGRNAAGLFWPAGAAGYAYDAAPQRRLPIFQMCKDLSERGVSDKDINGFIRACFEPDETAEDDAEADLHSAALQDPDSPEARHAAKEAVSKDSGMPKNHTDAWRGDSDEVFAEIRRSLSKIGHGAV